ncbi:hypothetical protein SBADM41S_10698 [Streptomyces badius]
MLSAGRAVHLWADAFAGYLPHGRAAVRVLEATGRTVLPPCPDCAGAAAYVSTGQLDAARRVMRRTLDGGPPPGEPLVVLEPSCAATLRTDLPELPPGDPRAAELAWAVRTFAQYLEVRRLEPPRLDRRGQPGRAATSTRSLATRRNGACANGCGPDRRTQRRMLRAGGKLGFEKGHWEVSVACAEERLLPYGVGLRTGGRGDVEQAYIVFGARGRPPLPAGGTARAGDSSRPRPSRCRSASWSGSKLFTVPSTIATSPCGSPGRGRCWLRSRTPGRSGGVLGGPRRRCRCRVPCRALRRFLCRAAYVVVDGIQVATECRRWRGLRMVV